MSKMTGKITFVLNKETESDVPACGCAIGDLLEKQVETNSPPSDGTTRDLS